METCVPSLAPSSHCSFLDNPQLCQHASVVWLKPELSPVWGNVFTTRKSDVVSQVDGWPSASSHQGWHHCCLGSVHLPTGANRWRCAQTEWELKENNSGWLWKRSSHTSICVNECSETPAPLSDTQAGVHSLAGTCISLCSLSSPPEHSLGAN